MINRRFSTHSLRRPFGITLASFIFLTFLLLGCVTEAAAQSMPVVIKPPKLSIVNSRITIQTGSNAFQTTTQFGPNLSYWTQSQSLQTGYFESIAIGSNQKLCNTETYQHPLNIRFKGATGNVIFTMGEAATSSGAYYNQQFSVLLANNYFQITQNGSAGGWLESVFSSTASINSIEVKNSVGKSVCLMTVNDGEDIQVNLKN